MLISNVSTNYLLNLFKLILRILQLRAYKRGPPMIIFCLFTVLWNAIGLFFSSRKYVRLALTRNHIHGAPLASSCRPRLSALSEFSMSLTRRYKSTTGRARMQFLVITVNVRYPVIQVMIYTPHWIRSFRGCKALTVEPYIRYTDIF